MWLGTPNSKETKQGRQRRVQINETLIEITREERERESVCVCVCVWCVCVRERERERDYKKLDNSFRKGLKYRKSESAKME